MYQWMDEKLEQFCSSSLSTKYGPKKMGLLVETDKLHGRLSGPATKRTLKRGYKFFGKKEYKKISEVPPSHIRDLEKKTRETKSTTVKDTHFVQAPGIGKRRKPDPQGEPGFLRVDTVHQGDLKDKKGVYHNNAVWL